MQYSKEYTLKNGETLIVRNAKIEEAKKVAVCENKIHDETEFLSYSSKDHLITEEEEIERIKSVNENLREVFLVAIYKNNIVATSVLRQKSKHKRFQHRSEFGIGVLKDYNGLGIAGKLMLSIIDCAKAICYEKIELDVAVPNENAIKLYKSFGFELSGTIKSCYKFSDQRYFDAYIMEKFIK